MKNTNYVKTSEDIFLIINLDEITSSCTNHNFEMHSLKKIEILKTCQHSCYSSLDIGLTNF